MNRSEKLEFKLRENRGYKKCERCILQYKDVGINIAKAKYFGLEELDKLNKKVKETIDFDNPKFEELEASKTFLESDILLQLFKNEVSNHCFIYSYECQESGMFLIETREALPFIIQLARVDYQETSYLVDENLKYYLTIHFNEKYNLFDIQLRLSK